MNAPPVGRDRRVIGPLKGLGQIPDSPLKETYKWADYVELRCLVHPDRTVTLGEVAAWFRVDPHESPDSFLADDFIAQQEDGDEVEQSSSGEFGAASAVDNRDRLARDVFRLLIRRHSLYEVWYPFTLSVDETELSVKSDPDVRHHLYVFLLMCAMGRYVRQHGSLTAAFERLCVPALTALLPSAEVEVFGTAEDGHYSGSLPEKLRVLAADVCESLQPGGEAIGTDESGDRGLDVAGIVDMGDDLPSRLVIFAQAACTDQWLTKQDSPTADAWDQIILVTAPPIVACCIPHCFRSSSGEWHDRTKIHRRLLLDRYRMMTQLQEVADDTVRDLISYEFVREIFALSYDE